MPTYDYRREDGTTFEVMQRITDEPLEVCPTTGQRVTRLVGGGVGLIFKGSGFYLTDYARKDNGRNGKSSEGTPSTGVEAKAKAEKKDTSKEKAEKATSKA